MRHPSERGMRVRVASFVTWRRPGLGRRVLWPQGLLGHRGYVSIS